MSVDSEKVAELDRHNRLQLIRLGQLKDELRRTLGREPSEKEFVDAIQASFGEYFREVDSPLNNWGTGEETGSDPRAMEPAIALDALERHYKQFSPKPKSPIPLHTCEDST